MRYAPKRQRVSFGVTFERNEPIILGITSIWVAADLRAGTERCNRSDVVPDLLVAPSNNNGPAERIGVNLTEIV